MISSKPSFGARFTDVSALGEGSFARVFRARDASLGHVVALKVLNEETQEALQALKQEFRMLRTVSHPHVVRYHELFADGSSWFYSMDWVNGAPLDSSPTCSMPASIELLRQVADGLKAIHDAGATHGDIKPDNVLVTAEGATCIVDFGLARPQLSSTPELESVGGTLAYVAPEVLSGSVSPASDWYSFAVLAYELIAGELPWPAPATHNPWARTRPSRPDAWLENDALWSAIQALLEPNPSRRSPAINALLAALGVKLRSTPGTDSAPTPLLGRTSELNKLREHLELARRGATRVVDVRGPSGIGKSRLIRELLATEGLGTQVIAFHSRCHTAERVAFNALDELVDQIGRLLLSEEPLVDPSAVAPVEVLAAMATLFPALARGLGVTRHANLTVDVQQLRALGIQGLRAFFAELSKRFLPVLVLDDVQWADRDSGRVLSDILAPSCPRMLVVLSYRFPDAEGSAFMDALECDVPRDVIDIGPIETHFVRECVRGHFSDIDSAVEDQLLRQFDGSPFLLDQFLRSQPEGGEGPRVAASTKEILSRRFSGLGEDERRALEIASVAARPFPEVAIYDAGAPQVTRVVLQHLADRGLIRLLPSEGCLEVAPYHDRVREAVIADIPMDHLKAVHLDLACALERQASTTPGRSWHESIFVHYAGAGRPVQAADQAEAAARESSESLSFDRAASFLQEALRLDGDPGRSARRGHALGRAFIDDGRGFDGARAYQAAATLYPSLTPEECSSLTERSELLSLAAEQLVRSGRLLEGKELFSELLADVGVKMPTSSRAAMRQAVSGRLRFFLSRVKPVAREQCDVSSEVTDRLDLLWRGSNTFGLTDFPLSHALGTTHLIDALKHGDRWTVARSLGVEAAFEAAIGTNYLRKRASRLLDLADGLLEPGDDIYWRENARAFRGITLWNQGEWKASAGLCESYASTIRRKCRGRDWEAGVGLLHAYAARAYLGDLKHLGEVMPEALRDANARGDRFAANFYRLGEQMLYLLAQDRPDETRAHIAAAKDSWPDVPYHLHLYHYVIIETYLRLYERDFSGAWQFIQEQWPVLEAAQFLSVEIGRVGFHHLRGRVAAWQYAQIDSTVTSDPTRARRDALKALVKSRRTVLRSNLAPAVAYGAHLLSLEGGLKGQRDRAGAQSQVAAKAYQRANMRLYGACADMAFDPDNADAAGVFEAEGVVRPELLHGVLWGPVT